MILYIKLDLRNADSSGIFSAPFAYNFVVFAIKYHARIWKALHSVKYAYQATLPKPVNSDPFIVNAFAKQFVLYLPHFFLSQALWAVRCQL